MSWFLATRIETLLDALANLFLKEKGLREEDTFFWVCDYVIRQTDVKTDLAYLGECVSAVGHTVLLMEPWHAPAPLTRAYCITEVYHTQKSGAQFDVVMSSAQQDALLCNAVRRRRRRDPEIHENPLQRCVQLCNANSKLSVCLPPTHTVTRLSPVGPYNAVAVRVTTLEPKNNSSFSLARSCRAASAMPSLPPRPPARARAVLRSRRRGAQSQTLTKTHNPN